MQSELINQVMATPDFSHLVSGIPFGLLDLDKKGVVRRYCPANEQELNGSKSDFNGRNFFTEVLPVEQVKDFQESFHDFMAHGESVQKFSTTFAHQGELIKVQIMLAHITDRSEGRDKRLALVRIMPDRSIDESQFKGYSKKQDEG
jgi:photoactive yellow protein